VPTSAWIGLMVLLTGAYSVGAVLLVNNYTGASALTEGRWHYWFLEALVQILIVLTALFSIPAVRRLERRRPFAFALGLLGVALVLRFELVALGDDANRIFRPHTVVWIFLIGWAVQRARTPAQRLLVTGIALACVPGFFGEPEREAIVAVGVVLLAWVTVVPVPRPLNRGVGLIAAASMYIYLTHWQVWPPLAGVLPFEMALAATLAIGVGAWLAVEHVGAAQYPRRVVRAVARSRARRRPAPLRAAEEPRLAEAEA